MQLMHKDEYEKMLNENEVDKSSILRSQKGKIFMIELVERDIMGARLKRLRAKMKAIRRKGSDANWKATEEIKI